MPPKISVIIPSRPGESVPLPLRALRAGACPPDRLEILHATGCHPSAQRNRAARAATGEILYFLDSDAAPATSPEASGQDTMSRLAACFAPDPDGALPRLIAGGPSWTPPSDSPFQRAAGLVFASPFGGGAVRARYASIGRTRPAGQHELILCNMMIDRRSFLDLGGFDERLYPNEENDLIVRFLRSGGSALYVPEAGAWRSQRPTLRAFCRQVFTYGRGRAEQTRLRPSSLSPMAPAAAALTLYLLAFPALAAGGTRFWGARGVLFALAPAALYALGLAAAGIHTAIRAGAPSMVLRTLPLFAINHIGYGLGFLAGLLGLARGRPAGSSEPVRIERIPL